MGENLANSGTITPGMDITCFSAARKVMAQAFQLLVLTMIARMTDTAVWTPAIRKATNASAEMEIRANQLLSRQTRRNRQQRLRNHQRAAVTQLVLTVMYAEMENAKTSTNVSKERTIAIPSNNALTYLENSDAIPEKCHAMG